jgi:hypothetical protein
MLLFQYYPNLLSLYDFHQCFTNLIVMAVDFYLFNWITFDKIKFHLISIFYFSLWFIFNLVCFFKNGIRIFFIWYFEYCTLKNCHKFIYFKFDWRFEQVDLHDVRFSYIFWNFIKCSIKCSFFIEDIFVFFQEVLAVFNEINYCMLNFLYF